MGLRDRLRGMLGQRPSDPSTSAARVAAPATGVRAGAARPGAAAARAPVAAAPPLAAIAPAPTVPAPYGPDALAGAVLVDVRDAAAFAAGHLPGARPLAPGDVRAFARGAPSDRPVVVVCADGVASSGVAERLAALGVARPGWLDGGLLGHGGLRGTGAPTSAAPPPGSAA